MQRTTQAAVETMMQAVTVAGLLSDQKISFSQTINNAGQYVFEVGQDYANKLNTAVYEACVK